MRQVQEGGTHEQDGLVDSLTTKFSRGAGWKEVMPRKAVQPAPSAATAGSAMLFLCNRIPAPLFSRPFEVASARHQLRIVGILQSKQFVDHEFTLAALDHDAPQRTCNHSIANRLVHAVADADRAAELLVLSLQSRRDVH